MYESKGADGPMVGIARILLETSHALAKRRNNTEERPTAIAVKLSGLYMILVGRNHDMKARLYLADWHVM